ncbi:MAG TPA: hypothetical protein VGD80_42275 [Kofleriaceae bacterium]
MLDGESTDAHVSETMRTVPGTPGASHRRTAMRMVLFSGLIGWFVATAPATASADDAHAEMAAALAAQADLHPAPLALPVVSAAPLHAAASSAVKRGIPARSASGDAARGAANAADRASRNAQGTPSQALAHRAQAAAAAAAGQAQSQRAMRRHRK